VLASVTVQDPATIDRERLANLCRRHGIRRLSLFGSALRGEAGAGSDLDVLVEFLPGTAVGLRFITIQDELADLFGRPVDLNTPSFLSRHFRERVLHEARAFYEAA
jgi:predicted nucleotidyltransferase